MKRLFFAYELPESAKGMLMALQNDIKRHNRSAFISWTPHSQWHVYTHFMGQVEDDAADRLAASMNFFDPIPVSLTCWSLDLFPNKQHPRVVVLKLTDPTGNAFTLRDQHYPLLQREDVDLDPRPWTPHITLGRVRSSGGSFGEDFSRVHIPDYSFQMKAITLFESLSGLGRREYKPIRSIELPIP